MASTLSRPRQLFQLVLVIIVGLTLTWFATIESVKVARSDQALLFQRDASILSERIERALVISFRTINHIAAYSQMDGVLDEDQFFRLLDIEEQIHRSHLVIALAEFSRKSEQGKSMSLGRFWRPSDADMAARTAISADDLLSAVEKAGLPGTPLPTSSYLLSALADGKPWTILFTPKGGAQTVKELWRLTLIPLPELENPLVVLVAEPVELIFNPMALDRDHPGFSFSLHFGNAKAGPSFAAAMTDTDLEAIKEVEPTGTLAYRHRFEFAGASWYVDLWPTDPSRPIDYSGAVITASAVLLLTSLVIFIIYTQAERSGRVVDIVDRRTRALKDAHAELEDNYRMLQKLNFDLDDARRSAETANEAKSEFLATVSHELRTPLNAILGFSQLLKDQALGEIGDERYIEYARDINESGEHLLQLINDILDLAKLEAGKIQLERRPVDVEDLVNGASHIMTHAAEAKDLTLRLNVAPDFPDHVMGDLLRLRQIVLNLLSNAVKFTDRGEITIHLRVSELSTGQESFIIEVQDTGIGIPEEKLPGLFERFSQVDAKRSRQHSGAGLGLAICHQLTSLMRGTIEVRSKLDEGTQFLVHLPLERADRPSIGDDDDAESDFI